MSSSTEERRAYARSRVLRRRLVIVLGVLLVLSLALPTVGIRGADVPNVPFGRSLVPSALYFLDVQPSSFGNLDTPALAVSLNVTYLGMAMHQFGLLLTLVTFFVLAGDDINRWLWWMLAAGAWLIALGAVAMVVGWFLMNQALLPASLGIAWFPALISGVSMIVASHRAKERIDYSWYQTKPELM